MNEENLDTTKDVTNTSGQDDQTQDQPADQDIDQSKDEDQYTATEQNSEETADAGTDAEDNVVVINADVPNNAYWYVVHTYSGHENKVAVTLKQRVEAAGYTDRIFKMFIPHQQKIVVSEGRKRSTEEKLFPGYLIVQMVMDDDSWYLIRSTPGVTGFVGMGTTPTPLPDSEVKALMRYARMEAPKFEAKFSVGDSVKVNDGPFKEFLGKVDEVNEEQGKVRVLVSVFGRETPLELDFEQVSQL